MRARVCAKRVLQDVGFCQFHVVVLGAVVKALVVIVHGHRKNPLGVVLTDHVIVQHGEDVVRARHSVAGFDHVGLVLFTDDIHAELNAFIADEYGWARNKLTDLMLTFSAKRAIEGIF